MARASISSLVSRAERVLVSLAQIIFFMTFRTPGPSRMIVIPVQFNTNLRRCQGGTRTGVLGLETDRDSHRSGTRLEQPARGGVTDSDLALLSSVQASSFKLPGLPVTRISPSFKFWAWAAQVPGLPVLALAARDELRRRPSGRTRSGLSLPTPSLAPAGESPDPKPCGPRTSVWVPGSPGWRDSDLSL